MNLSGKKAFLPVLTALGIVYGDIGTSPLYALRECFHGHYAIAPDFENVLGVLSLILWAMIVVVSFKYLAFVMRADNKGEGGALALTALACFHKTRSVKRGNAILLAMGLFGSALLVGDGMLTPAISVMSAIEGLKIATPLFESLVEPITVMILIGLFAVQRHGTSKLGNFFGPVMVVWFSVLGVLGAISLMKSPEVLASINPLYGLRFLYHHKSAAFFVLGAVFLVVTGGEALYADMGHFGRKVIAKGWYFVAFPGLALNYLGQGALVLRDPALAQNPFYFLAPKWALIPLVILATMATIIASQAIISGLFSLARQCIQLGYSPRLSIVHTSEDEVGQIYVPPINWIILVGTIWLVVEFDNSSNLAGAYGIAVSFTMIITTILTTAVALKGWRWSPLKVGAIMSGFLLIDLAFAGANIMKLEDGGWVTLVIAFITFFLMTTWHKGRKILMQNMRAKSYPFDQLMKDIEIQKPVRVSGTAVYMVGDAQTTPPALMNNLKHNKVLHEKVVFLTVVGKEVPHVLPEERFNVTALEGGFFRVVAKYGFSDTPNVKALIDRCQVAGIGLDFKEPTFFLGREILISTRGGEMSFWRKKVFTFLAKNSQSATTFFNLPSDSVFEVGMQVEM